MLNGIDLFSGIGGITRALDELVKPILYCENDKYCQAILLSRMSGNNISRAPIWDDIRTLSGMFRPKTVDIMYGGFPCQDISSAGTGKGLEGKRSGLVFEVLRLTKEIKPKFVFLENVPRIRTKGLSIIGKELANLGYDCRWLTLSAQEIGAPHKRERWFLLAHTNNSNRLQSICIQKSDVEEKRPEKQRENEADKFSYATWWEAEPEFSRVANGIPNQLERHRAMGNAVVPQQARAAFKYLIGLK